MKKVINKLYTEIYMLYVIYCVILNNFLNEFIKYKL